MLQAVEAVIREGRIQPVEPTSMDETASWFDKLTTNDFYVFIKVGALKNQLQHLGEVKVLGWKKQRSCISS